MKVFGKALLIPALMLMSITSCHKEYFDFDRLSKEIELTPDVVAPLIYGSVSMEDLIEYIDSTGYTSVDDQGLIYIVYADTGFAVKADTMIDIPDKVVSKYYIESDITGNPDWGLVVGDTTYFLKQDTLSYGMEGNDRLDSVIIRAGTFQIDMASEFRHTGILTVSSNQIFDKDGLQFSTTFLISDLSGNFTDQKIFDMNGYTVVTEEDQDYDSTYIVMDYNLALIYSGNTIEVGEECSIDMSFLNSKFSKVFGFVDEREVLNESGEFDIPLYEDRPELVDIIFADPRINIYAKNSVGVHLEIELDSVIATSSIDGSTLEMTFNGVNPFAINAPDISQLGEIVNTEININNTTSNIDELLAIAPSKLAYNVIGRTTYETLEDEHFLLDTSMLELQLEILLPLDLSTTGFGLTDTFDFELFGEDGIDTDLIRFLQVNLGTDNGLPGEFQAQVYLADSNFIVIDSLFDETVPLLKPAPVDAEGIITASVQAENVADIDQDKLSRLYDVKYAIFEAKIITSNNGQDFVKLYTHYDGLDFEPAYALDFDISIYGGFKINNQNTGN